jgi:hypothetical protein
MMTDYNTSLDLVAKPVNQFHTHRAAYRAPDYKEAHARQGSSTPISRRSCHAEGACSKFCFDIP